MRAFLRRGNGAGAIVGLHAPGGLGKTELAKRAAEDLKGEFEGVLWLEVGEQTPEQVVAALLVRLGVQLPPGTPYEAQKNELHARLRGCRYLLILDDVRQKALAGLGDFLPAKPCAALLTSRVQQIPGVQRTFALDRMTPEQADDLLEAILGPEAVAAEREAAERLAARCGYNPLALEIAARRIRQLQGLNRPIARYFELAAGRFAELKMDGDARWDMERVFDLSYLDLSERDRARFRALGAFHPSGFAPEAAAFLWGLNPDHDEDLAEARRTLSRFINLSLVKVVPGEQERYRLHDLLDEYAARKMEIEGGAEEANRRLADWVEKLFTDHYKDDPSTAPEVALEIENLRRAMEWASRQKNGSRLAELVHAARNWLLVLNLYDVWGQMAEKALALGISEEQARANVLKAMGDVQQFRDERDAALASYQQALTLYRAVGDRLGEATTLRRMGHVQLAERQIKLAEESYITSLRLCKAIDDRLGEAYTLRALGDITLYYDEFSEARKNYEQSISIFRQIGDKVGQANALTSTARLNIVEKKTVETLESDLEIVIELRRQTQDAGSLGEDYLGIAVALATIERWDEMEIYCAKAESIFDNLTEKQPLLQIVHFRNGIEHVKKAMAHLEAGKRKAARDLLQDALEEFKKVGDFLLFKWVERLIAACEE
ncbi:MAG: NB-ARC domain-containing protein [Anaerolineales bacterium]|nr:NB-ARC domain-containing protein [Anaerolineales bacterium]